MSPVVIAISGVKNSGKTTFLTCLIPLLRAKGLRVGVIKHDGHDFMPDIPGTDSFRLRESGAMAVAIYSQKRWMLVYDEPPAGIETLLANMAEFDLVLLEGFKDSGWPKIELVRAAVSEKCVCSADTLPAVVTDTGLSLPGIRTLPLDGYTEAAQLVWEYVQHEKRRD